jgi:hypothetical protein
MYPGRQQKPQRIGSGVVGILIAVNVDYNGWRFEDVWLDK